MKPIYYGLLINVPLLLTGCGGGGGSSSSDDSTSSSTTYSVTGYVLDGNVGTARVCFDLDGDNQCTSDDKTTYTDSNGYFELTYSDSSYLSSYELISDVRYSDATDSDYSSGAPDYDYVLKAFAQSDSVVLSPISTYMNYLSVYSDSTDSEILAATLDIIETNEQYSYSISSLTQTQLETYLQGNFIQSESASNQVVASFNTRLHNINEVLARKMQESQIAWEDNFNNGDITVDDSSWSSISATVVTNANATVFQGFDTIVEEVESYDYSSFDAETVSGTLGVSLPDDDTIQSLVDYIEALDEIDTEFSGTTYRNSYETSGYTVYQYYVFGSDGISVYVDMDGTCAYASAPTYSDYTDWDAIIDELDSIYESSSYYSNYSPMTEVSGPPTDCSSVYSLLEDALGDDIEVADSVEDDSSTTTFVGFPSSNVPSSAVSNVANQTVVQRSSSSPSIVSSSSSNNFASGTLNSCSGGGVWNSCSASSK